MHAYYQTNYTFSSKAKRCVIVYPINCSARHLDTAPILTQKFCRSASCSVSLTLFLSSFLSTLPLFPDCTSDTSMKNKRSGSSNLCFLSCTLYSSWLPETGMGLDFTYRKHNMKRCVKGQLQKSAWTRLCPRKKLEATLKQNS